MTHDDVVEIAKAAGIPMAPPDDPYYRQDSYTVFFVSRKEQLPEAEKKHTHPRPGKRQGK